MEQFPALRDWKPEECDEEGRKYPEGIPRDWEFLELEVFRWLGCYTWGEWEREDVRVKARFIAHFLEHEKREGYLGEKHRIFGRKEDGKPKHGGEEYFQFRQGGGVPA